MKAELKKITPRIAEYLPKQVAEKEISFALQAIAASPQLQKCSTLSLQTSVINSAMIGITLNPAAKEGYLVPRWNSNAKAYEATFLPSYVGLAKLLIDAGGVTSIAANVVYQGDTFDLDLADNHRPITHRPELVKSKRGEIIGAYALATLPDGTRQPEWMDIEELNAIRDNSDSFKNEKTRQYSPWETSTSEMYRKTVVRRLYKYAPRGTGKGQEKLDKAIELSDSDSKATFNQILYVEDLLRTSTIDPQRIDAISRNLSSLSAPEAAELIEELQANQVSVDPRKQNMERANVMREKL